MQATPGTYALLLHADAERTIEVGALGEMTTTPGVYVYVGSAFGPGGLRARVRRHARADGTLHWHVDYVRAVTTLEAVWYTHDAERRECKWAAALRGGRGATVPMQGFGASDCACPAHLVAFDEAPPFDAFREQMMDVATDHAPIRRTGAHNIGAEEGS